MVLTKIFETVRNIKELKFNPEESESFPIGDNYVIPLSVFIITQTTHYPTSSYQIEEVKLKACQVEEKNSWTTVSGYIEYKWSSEENRTTYNISELPEWLANVISSADNISN